MLGTKTGNEIFKIPYTENGPEIKYFDNLGGIFNKDTWYKETS